MFDDCLKFLDLYNLCSSSWSLEFPLAGSRFPIGRARKGVGTVMRMENTHCKRFAKTRRY